MERNWLNMAISLNDHFALIFDMDGTMIDNMQYHYQAWRVFLKEHNLELNDEELRDEIRGTNREIMGRLFGSEVPVEELDQMGDYKEALYREIYRPHLQLIKGLLPFLRKTVRAGISMAIATSANQANIEFVVNGLELRPFFKVVVSSEEVDRGKPYPDTFLEAAHRLHFPADQCIVFEDAPTGIEAARRANMKAVALTTTRNPSEFDPYDNIIQVIPDYNHLEYELI